MGSTCSCPSHVVPMIDGLPVTRTRRPCRHIRQDPIPSLCHFIRHCDLAGCKRIFRRLTWEEIVAVDTRQMELRNSANVGCHFQVEFNNCLLHEGRNTANLPLHLLLTRSQSGQHDRKYHKMFKLFLKYGYDTDIQDFRGNLALHIAMGRGQLYNVVVYEVKFLQKHKHYTLKFIKGLCESGCNINIYDNLKHWTPLHLAAKYNMYSCIEVLVEYGARINQQDYQGKTPLMLAIEHGCLEGFACLLCFNPDLQTRTLGQQTALHFAVQVNTFLPQFREFAVQKLLQHGVDPNAQDVNGDTPLHIAARMNGSTEVIIRLLRYGADPSQFSKRGVTPFYEYMCNERIFPTGYIQTEAQLMTLLNESVYKAFRAFDVCLPRGNPRTIRDPENRLPHILQIPLTFKPFIRLVAIFGTANNPESLQDQCIRRIQKYVGLRNLADNSITAWKLGLPRLLQEFVGGELFRKALEVPVTSHPDWVSRESIG